MADWPFSDRGRSARWVRGVLGRHRGAAAAAHVVGFERPDPRVEDLLTQLGHLREGVEHAAGDGRLAAAAIAKQPLGEE